MPTAPGYASCAIQMKHALITRSAYITFGVHPSDPDPLAVCGAISTAFASAGSLLAQVDNDVAILAYHASVGQDGAPDLVGALPSTQNGGASASTLPANCAVLIHKRTARGGRRGRGRFYLPWVGSETLWDEAGKLAGASVTTLQTAANNFRSALVSGGVPMVLLHDQGLTPEGPPNDVTSLIVDPLIGTQRRRLGR